MGEGNVFYLLFMPLCHTAHPRVSMPWTESPRNTHPAPFEDEGKMCQRDEVRLMSLLLEVPENSVWGKRGVSCQHM